VDTFCHSGSPKIELENENHSMVLIGIRKDKGKTHFLLQNCWSKKQFVEVDEEYFKKCNGVLHYVETPQISIIFF